MLTYFLFVLGFILLIKGADFLIDGASSVAKKLNIPDFAIGLIVIAVGTSLPEFVVNVTASVHGNHDLSIGNVIGSNITNILLVLGVAAMILPLRVHAKVTWREIPFSLLAAAVLFLLANDVLVSQAGTPRLDRLDGVIMLLFFATFLYYIFGIRRYEAHKHVEISARQLHHALIMIIVGIIGLMAGGRWIVSGAVEIAKNLGFSESFIGLTIVAIGTSLPELAAAAMSAHKKNVDMAIGSIIGSNIFNIFWILGLSAIIQPIVVSPAWNIDFMALIGATALLFVFMFLGQKHVLKRWQGATFILLYVGYLIFLLNRG